MALPIVREGIATKMKHKSCHKLQNRFTAEQPSLSAVSVSEAPRNVPSGQVLPHHSTLADEQCMLGNLGGGTFVSGPPIRPVDGEKSLQRACLSERCSVFPLTKKWVPQNNFDPLVFSSPHKSRRFLT